MTTNVTLLVSRASFADHVTATLRAGKALYARVSLLPNVITLDSDLSVDFVEAFFLDCDLLFCLLRWAFLSTVLPLLATRCNSGSFNFSPDATTG